MICRSMKAAMLQRDSSSTTYQPWRPDGHGCSGAVVAGLASGFITSAARRGQQQVRGFLGDHDGRGIGVGGNLARHDGRVNDPQIFHAIYLQLGTHHTPASTPIRQVPTG